MIHFKLIATLAKHEKKMCGREDGTRRSCPHPPGTYLLEFKMSFHTKTRTCQTGLQWEKTKTLVLTTAELTAPADSMQRRAKSHNGVWSQRSLRTYARISPFVCAIYSLNSQQRDIRVRI